jgi:hypothetical protein
MPGNNPQFSHRLAGDPVLIAPVSLGKFQVSGNFTGNFAILGLRDTLWYQETAALQPLLEQFPTQIIRENILRIREFLNGIRKLQASIRKRPFLTHLFSVVRTRSVLADEFLR